MKKNNKMHCLIYRLRKSGLDVKIDVKNRIIYYEYQNSDDEIRMKNKFVVRLCSGFGFARQAVIN